MYVRKTAMRLAHVFVTFFASDFAAYMNAYNHRGKESIIAS